MKTNDILGKILSFGLPYLDRFLPGYKTMIIMAWGLLSAFCQFMGWHVFDENYWKILGFLGGATVTMKLNRGDGNIT